VKLVSIIAITLISLQGLTQLPDYHVQLFDESFGVRTSDVRKVIKDKQGFIWIMHHDGVQRFDGKHILDFVPGPILSSIICDNSNRIWVASSSKLYRFSNDHTGFVPVSVDTIKKLAIYQVYKRPDKEVWVLTNAGLYVFDESKQVFRKHTDPVLANLKKVQSRSIDDGRNTQTIFLLIEDSLKAFRPGKGSMGSLPVDNVREVCALTDDLALVSTWTGVLYLCDFSKGEVKNIDISRHLNNVQDFFIIVFHAVPNGRNKFLLATSKGMIEYDMDTGDFRQLKLFHKGKPLEGNLVFRDIYVDDREIAWATYTNYGLISFKKNAADIGLVRNHETDMTKAWDNHVRNFAEDEKGNIWLATVNGFARWNLQQGTIQPYFAKEGATDRINHYSIRGIVYDGRYLILGQTNKGIWLYDPVVNHYRRPAYLPGDTGEATRKKIEGDFIDQIYTLHNGNHVVVARDGGYLLDGRTYRVTELDFPGKKENLNYCFQDSKRNLWIATGQALYCLDSHFIFRHKIPMARTSGGSNTMCEWKDGSLIIGGTGLYMVSTFPALMVRKLHPFFDRIVIHILYKDKENKLWLATSEGLFRFDIQTQKIESFSNFENIEGNSFYPNSFCRSRQEWLFLGSTRGIIYFNPEKIGKEKDSLGIFISDMKVNGDDTGYTGAAHAIRLRYFQNTVDFSFVAPYFGNANKIKYRYRLQGLDTGWIINGNSNTARFHALQPGHYEFQAAASLNGIDWFESGEKISFSIGRPFWKTGWFYTMVALAIGLAVYALYRYQLNKKLEVERLRLGIARDLHDDIGSAVSNIHIISSMAMKKQPENGTAGQVFGKIRESSKAILENMQDIVWAINPENDTLEQVLAKMKEFAGELCESAGIEYGFETDKNLEAIKLTVNKRKDLFLVFKEAMNNAVKYSGGTIIRISLLRNPGGWLVLEIMDNGKGFEKNEIQPGNGLRNMAERAKEAKGKMVIASGTGLGTRVELRIPIT
jgi:signal transduction histidine kinase/ligand-binding sensor domain-containing protein